MWFLPVLSQKEQHVPIFRGREGNYSIQEKKEINHTAFIFKKKHLCFWFVSIKNVLQALDPISSNNKICSIIKYQLLCTLNNNTIFKGFQNYCLMDCGSFYYNYWGTPFFFFCTIQSIGPFIIFLLLKLYLV